MTKPWHRWPPALRSNPPGVLRGAIYQAQGWVCALRYPHCTVTTTELDHIIRPEDGGAWFDPGNLRGTCGACNKKRRRLGNVTPPPVPVPPTPLWSLTPLLVYLHYV